MAPVQQLLLIALVIPAAFYDFRFRRIPNWLTVSGLLLGLMVHAVFSFGSGPRSSELGLSAAGLGFAAAFGVYAVLYSIRAMGAGDVKLMAAIGCIVGPTQWLTIFAGAAILGGITGLIMVAIRGRLRHTLWNVGFIVGEFARFRAPYLTRAELDVSNPKALTLPHGAVIAAACVCVIALQLSK
jgi:prepilin peptidase CpaA